MNDTTPGLAPLAVFGIISICIFLIARAIVLWYWRVNHLIDRQDGQIKLLKDISHELQDMKVIIASSKQMVSQLSDIAQTIHFLTALTHDMHELSCGGTGIPPNSSDRRIE